MLDDVMTPHLDPINLMSLKSAPSALTVPVPYAEYKKKLHLKHNYNEMYFEALLSTISPIDQTVWSQARTGTSDNHIALIMIMCQVSGSCDPLVVLVTSDSPSADHSVNIKLRIINAAGFKIPSFSVQILVKSVSSDTQTTTNKISVRKNTYKLNRSDNISLTPFSTVMNSLIPPPESYDPQVLRQYDRTPRSSDEHSQSIFSAVSSLTSSALLQISIANPDMTSVTRDMDDVSLVFGDEYFLPNAMVERDFSVRLVHLGAFEVLVRSVRGPTVVRGGYELSEANSLVCVQASIR
jgi:hypothetical protein